MTLEWVGDLMYKLQDNDEDIFDYLHHLEEEMERIDDGTNTFST